MNTFHAFRSECEQLLAPYIRDATLERPPRGIDADLAFPCFALAKDARKPPQLIAEDIASKIHVSGTVARVAAANGYVNFYANWGALGREIVSAIRKKKEDYGHAAATKEKIMIEYSSPNTNKPLHIGHLRNDSLGMTIANVLECCGYTVVRTAIINDRGVHICKSMYAYQRWGKNKKPDKKPDHFVGDFYVMFEKKLKKQPALENELQSMLQKWEAGDKKTRALWKKMNDWVLTGMKETYAAFGSQFDFWTLESDIYDKAKPIINEGVRKGVFFKGAKDDILAKLEPELPNKVVLRADGTSIYITQDLVLAKFRFGKHKISRLIYVVASEQNLHFRQLFRILELLGYGFVKDCIHLSYGLVNLPSGRMKTREGTVVDADDLIAEMTALAAAEIGKREKVSKKELAARSRAIALGAIKYYLLRMEPVKDMLFDPEQSLSFEGDTGPYLQYTYARARSILRKSRKKPAQLAAGDREVALIKKLSQYEYVVRKCAAELKPHYLTTYLNELATLFNEFYHAERVIGADDEAALLGLVEAVSIVLGNGLALLGIEALERM